MHDIFYFTDIHGCYDLYKAIMDYCYEQDPEATIIYGGDACDRGPDGYKIMNELLDNPKVIYLKGNHEDIFVKAARFIINDYKDELTEEKVNAYLYSCSLKDYAASQVRLSIINGGKKTLMDWMLAGMSNEFVSRINNLNVALSYENIDFCHAGGDPRVFKRVSDDEYEGEFIDKDDLTHILWDRNYLTEGWTTGRICIYGHTPAWYLAAKYYGKDKAEEHAHPCAYIGLLDDRFTGKKINMDCGTFWSRRAYVLNVLTMKAQGFKDTNLNDNEIRKHNVEKIEMIQM